MNPQAVFAYFTELQTRIVGALEKADGGRFRADAWERAEGGGGLTKVIEGGALFERGGVNLSRVQGRALPPSASASRRQAPAAGRCQRSSTIRISMRVPPA